MVSYDFDINMQKEFNRIYSDLQRSHWKQWLEIASEDEYEALVLKNTGLDAVENLYNRLMKEKTESKSFSVDLKKYIENDDLLENLVMIHTSGTTSSSLSGIKWFHMKKPVINSIWAPGMSAIFESSGLTSKNAAVIFVPSRLSTDGTNSFNRKKYITLYSAEFSQRIMLSIIKPSSYLLYEYKDSKNLEIISKILSMEEISVVSAPAATILGWADIENFKSGVEKSLQSKIRQESLQLDILLKMIKSEGLNAACIKIQKMLSDKLSKAVIIFSISFLNATQWELIRNFMKWDKGAEKFTNLYVGSEIGPFASSLGNFELARSNKMYVFPLTLPIIEYKKNRDLINRTSYKIGKLYVSRFDNSHPLLNINTDDVIIIEDQQKLPLIGGEIIRSGFKLKYPIDISKKVKIPDKVNIFAGDYFTLEEFDFTSPRYLLDCLVNNCNLKIDSLLLVSTEIKNHIWELIIPREQHSECQNKEKFINVIYNCPKESGLKKAIENNYLIIRLIDEQPVDFLATRSEVLAKVQKGNAPKGILKRWPLYIVTPASVSEQDII